MAKILAAEKGVPPGDREEYFVAGLLHDIGKIPFGDEYTHVLRKAGTEYLELAAVEQLLMDIDHQEVGALISEKWTLNQAITDSICNHHNPEGAGEQFRQLVSFVALADMYACIFDIGYAGNRFPSEESIEKIMELAGFKWEQLSTMAAIVDEEIRKAEVFLQV